MHDPFRRGLPQRFAAFQHSSFLPKIDRTTHVLGTFLQDRKSKWR